MIFILISKAIGLTYQIMNYTAERALFVHDAIHKYFTGRYPEGNIVFYFIINIYPMYNVKRWGVGGDYDISN